jgi:hypothetical protein
MKFNRQGDDGSAKCNIVLTGKGEDFVAGVVFEITAEDLAKLDDAERGCERKGFRLKAPMVR